MKSKEETCYYDFDTSNKSFLEMAEFLKNKGIKNYKFMLKLNNTHLKEVDPYSEEITKEEQRMVITECIENPWYYLREIVRLPDYSAEYCPFLADRSNMAQAWCAFNYIDTWVSKPRQLRLTTHSLAIMSWIFMFGGKCLSININTKNIDMCKFSLMKLNLITDVLPSYLLFPNFDGKPYRINPINQNFLNLNGVDKDYTSDWDEKYFTNRYGANYNYFDDAAGILRINEVVNGTKKLIMKGNPYCRLFSSTRTTNNQEQQREIYDQSLMWDETMYDQDIDSLFYTVYESGTGLMYIEYKWNDLGLTEEWLTEQKKYFAEYEDIYRYEVLLEWKV